MSIFADRMAELEKRLGRGPTFSTRDMQLIIKGVVPVRILLGCKVLRGPPLKTYSKAYERLVELERDYGPGINMAAFGAGGEGA